mmetsp:Transcript_47522/g.34795  ORF Transcript_47522/g.34795 Transcript_47522/m.34795 type:complete len:80 (+) Transcript_47522:169-408(+)
MFDEEVLPAVKRHDSHAWRLRRLWNEECDLVFRFYFPILKMLYDKFSGKQSKPGQPNFMSMEELNLLLMNAEVCDESFG